MRYAHIHILLSCVEVWIGVPIPFPAPESGASAGLGALPSVVECCGEVDAGDNTEVFAFWQNCWNLGNSHEYGRWHTITGYSLREVYRLRLRLELLNQWAAFRMRNYDELHHGYSPLF